MVLISFFAFYMLVGGSAGIGYREGGRYFVGSHGDYTEVARVLWIASCVLEALFFVRVLIIPVGALLLSEIKERINLIKRALHHCIGWSNAN